MARLTHAEFITAISLELQDSSNAIFKTTELPTILADAVEEYSAYDPFKTRETLTTTASKDLSIAGIDNLLSIEELEYEVDKIPRQFRNWTEHYTGVISMLIDRTPAASQTVYAYCNKVHKIPSFTDLAGEVDLIAGYAAGISTIHVDNLGSADRLLTDMEFTIASDSTGTVYRLTEDTLLASNEGDITFTPALAEAIADGDVVTFANSSLRNHHQERLIVALAAARAILSKGVSLLSEGSNTIAVLATINTAIGNMTTRITQAITDIASARTAVGLAPAIILEANTSIDNMAAQISLAVTDIASGRTAAGLAPAILLEANTLIDNMAARITQAIADIASGRTAVDKVDALITSANGALAKIDTEVGQALADLDTGRALINDINKGGPGVPGEYARYASGDVQNARGYLEEAVGYMRQGAADESVSGSYGSLAVRELNAAVASLNEASGLLRQVAADINLANTYGALAVRQLNTSSENLRQANGFLAQARADESVAGTYGGVAIRELNVANSSLAQAGGYIQKISAGLRVAQTVRLYREEGERRLALVQRELRRLRKPKFSMALPRA